MTEEKINRRSVFVVTSGNHSDYGIWAVYETWEAAAAAFPDHKEWVRRGDNEGPWIEEYPFGMTHFKRTSDGRVDWEKIDL